MADNKRANAIDVSLLEAEVERLRSRDRFWRTFRTVGFLLITLIALIVIAVTLFFPVLKIDESAMAPSLSKGAYVLCSKNEQPERGDILAYYFDNVIIVRRVIGLPGDEIVLDEDGYVYVNGQFLQEDYVYSPTLGACDLDFPFTVPQGEYFVLADNRLDGIDSRVEEIGCVSEGSFFGILKFVIWPIFDIGKL